MTENKKCRWVGSGLLVIVLILSLYSMASGALFIEQGERNGVAYATGGIGLEEREAMEKMAGNYSLKVELAATSGSYLADIKVCITDMGGKKVFEYSTSDPWLYVDLAAGTYKITASFKQESRMQEVKVDTGLKTVMFHWKR
ncbi:MAG: carboxypeptidase regulatory-like domain-containing protein [Deltaproteobacteria bacterium]|nr:carboxypeptidase regulatory-like domain-containing protein [Deltaproteobacteria bacterium]